MPTFDSVRMDLAKIRDGTPWIWNGVRFYIAPWDNAKFRAQLNELLAPHLENMARSDLNMVVIQEATDQAMATEIIKGWDTEGEFAFEEYDRDDDGKIQYEQVADAEFPDGVNPAGTKPDPVPRTRPVEYNLVTALALIHDEELAFVPDCQMFALQKRNYRKHAVGELVGN